MMPNGLSILYNSKRYLLLYGLKEECYAYTIGMHFFIYWYWEQRFFK